MFKKAERKQAKLKLALTGPSGSGKTYSALRLASGISDKIAVIDTENHSASLYADKFNFDVLEISPPYTTDKYIQAILAAENHGYEVIVIDSISHQWAGEGGILNQKEKLDSRGGNSYTNWSKLTPEQERFKSIILQCKSHLICTIRSKQDYVVEANDKGKQAPRKVGLAPVQREGMEYEFTVVLDITMDHSAKASKDRTELFMNESREEIFTITEDTGKKLKEWISKGKEVVPVFKMGDTEVAKIKAMCESAQWSSDKLREYIKTFGKAFMNLNKEDYEALCITLEEEAFKLITPAESMGEMR